jgi:LPS export ABC transporter protein LptC
MLHGSARIGISLAALLACAACDPSGGVEPPSDVEPPVTTLRGVVFEGYGAGEREFEVRAARALVEPELGRARLFDVEIAFAEDERGPIGVRAGEAVLELARDDFVLQGGVEGTGGEGERFWTDDLRYEQARRMLVTDAPVRVERSSLEFRGRGMEIDLDARTVRFTQRVEATVGPR